MKKRVVGLSLGLLLQMFCACSIASGQTNDSVWSHLEKADSAIKASNVAWKMVDTLQPNPVIDPDKEGAAAASQAARSGLGSEQQKIEQRIAYDSALLSRSGYSVKVTLDFEYQGSAISCEGVQTLAPQIGGGSQGDTAKFLDIYDGVNSISLDSTSPTGEPDKGSLYRDQAHHLQHSAPDFGDLIFLVGTPVSGDFSSADTIVTKEPNGMVILEKKFDQPLLNRQGSFPLIARLKVSTGSWRPVSMEVFNSFNNRLHTRYTVIASKRFPGDIIFPSHLLVQRFTESGRVYRTNEYYLQSGTFNDDADLTTLKRGVPEDSILNDFRFGVNHSLRYKTPKRLPSDTDFRKVQQKILASESKQNKSEGSTRILVFVSIIVAVIAAFTMLRLRRKTN